MATASRLMTEDEFLALPDDDSIDRELIHGELLERPMSTRSYAHSIVISNVNYRLKLWLELQPTPRGRVLGADARIRLSKDPATFIGVDAAYLAPGVGPASPRTARFADGPPTLVVEVLSPSDRTEDVADKVLLYLASGVPLIWIVDYRLSTVIVHRPDARPQLFNVDQELTAEPHLPGFRVAVAEVFEDLD